MRRFYSFFFLLFFIPNLVWGAHLGKDACKERRDMARNELAQMEKLIAQIDAYSDPKNPKIEGLFNEAIFHCDKAYGLYNDIVHAIRDRQDKTGLVSDWHPSMTQKCQNDSADTLSKLRSLRKRESAFLRQKSLERQDLAERKKQNLSYKLKDAHTLSLDLDEISHLYEEAANFSKTARDLLKDIADEKSKNILKDERQTFLDQASQYKDVIAITKRNSQGKPIFRK